MERNDSEDLAAHQDVDRWFGDVYVSGYRSPHAEKMEIRGYLFTFLKWLQSPDAAKVRAMLNRNAGR